MMKKTHSVARTLALILAAAVSAQGAPVFPLKAALPDQTDPT